MHIGVILDYTERFALRGLNTLNPTATTGAPTFHHISHIVLASTSSQMVGVYTPRVIAGVKNHQPLGAVLKEAADAVSATLHFQAGVAPTRGVLTPDQSNA